MRQVLAQFLVLSLLLGFPGTVRAEDFRWFWQGGEKKWQSHMEADYKPGNHERQALVLSPFVVVAEDEKSLIFANIRNTLFWEDGDFANEINIGGGYRRLMGDNCCWILGGYAFYDYLDSLFDNKFHQGTLGVELLGRDWDLRLNGYISDMDEKFVGANAQSVQLIGTQLTMNGTVEQSMSGLDAEVGWRLPFSTEGILGDTRLYAGGFYFDASEVSSIVGPSTRFEMRIHDIPFLWEGSRITLGTQYTWDDERNSNVTGLIGLRIPFGAPSRSKPLTYMERRMTDSVVRDIAVVTNLGGGDGESVETGTGAPIENAYFFDDEDDSAECSFEFPCDIETAIDTGENNLLIGLNLTGDVMLTSDNTLFNGQTVMGGGSGLVVYGAESGQQATFFAPGGPATLFRGTGTGLILRENNTIVGLTFEGMDTALNLHIDGLSTKLDLYDNNFRELDTAIELIVHNQSALTARITNNLFEQQDTGIDVEAEDSFEVDLQVLGNIFRDMGTGIFAQVGPTGSSGPSSWSDAIHGNTFEDMDLGIEINVDFSGSENYTHVSTVYENYFRNLDWDDYELNVNGSSPSGEIDLQVSVTENRSENGDSFFDFEMDPIPYGEVEIEVVDNDIENAEDTPIDIYIDQGPDVTANISRNRIENVEEGDAIEVDIIASGDENGHTLTIADNLIREVYNNGIEVYFNDSYDADVSITGNDIAEIGDSDEGGDAIQVEFEGTGHDEGVTADISENIINAVEDDGIEVAFDYGYDGVLTVADNAISDVGGDGVEADFNENGHDQGNTATFSRNAIDGTGGDGIDVYVAHGYDSTVTIADNTIEDAGEDGGDGIVVDFDENGGNEGGAGDSVAITGNSVDRTGDDGIEVYFGDSYGDPTLTIANNTLNALGGSGVEVWFRDGNGSEESATIAGNAISDAGNDGIDVYFSYGPDASLAIEDNTIDRVENEGIIVEFNEAGSDTGNTARITGNQITDADGNGIEVYAQNGYDTNLEVSGNEISNAGVGEGSGDGILVTFQDNGHDVGDSATITGNTIQVVEDDGIEVEFYEGYDGTLTVADNEILDVGDEGIYVEFIENGHDVGNTISVTDNAVDGAGDDNIDIFFADSYGTIDVSDNELSDAEAGIEFNLNSTSEVLVTIASNQISDIENEGVDVQLIGSDANQISISNNEIAGSAIVPDPNECTPGCGIYVELESDSDGNEIVINGNQVEHSDYAGIAVYAETGSAANTVRIGGNSVDQSDVYGISIVSNDASNTITSEVNGSTQNNVVENSGIADTFFDPPFTGTIRVNGEDVP